MFVTAKWTIPSIAPVIWLIVTLRNMPTQPGMGAALATGGDFWFMDLTLPDPLFLLPIAVALSSVIMIVRYPPILISSQRTGGTSTGEWRQDVENDEVWRAVPQCVLCILCFWVSCGPQSMFVSVAENQALLLFWIGTTIVTTFTTLLLTRPAIRTSLGLPLVGEPSLNLHPGQKLTSSKYEMSNESKEKTLKLTAKMSKGKFKK